MEYSSSVPPGFRFHPTEEELVGYYLNRKINSLNIDLDVIVEIDLYRIEPWDIQDRCNYGYEDQNEWYFFSYKDKKYPTGTRMNRATAAGFWKATGRDKAIFTNNRMIGMRKTLVYYKGRAPNGQKSDWIMHEYRLQTSQLAPPQEQGWVVCRAFKKPTPNQHQRLGGYAHYATSDYNNEYKSISSYSEIPSSSNTKHMVYPNQIIPYYSPINSQENYHFYPNSADTPKHPTELAKEEVPSFPINDGPNYAQNGSLDHDSICEDERTNIESSCVDWKSFSELITEPHLPSSDYELNSQNIPSHLFINFPDS